ncbi:hypothetical protein CMV42_23670 [Escherichia coli]|nr:hypothetical protein [Salmonella enterica subsp. enterica serovar Hadar]RJJ86501.1 hypothetical protein CMV55_23470 [Escherichia coli]EBX1254494.1 hypothetical protein [Salmonella enterica subsp. enterica serovar Hadar]RJJ88322.1 hypothetical protein CMV44_23450 [Escherichia coli]RJJ99396.1 hypothetical protein CMV42_23670 [Escherichia coli]
MLGFPPCVTTHTPLYFRDNLGGETRISGAFVFQSLTLPPTTKPVESSRKTDPFTITPVVRPP